MNKHIIVALLFAAATVSVFAEGSQESPAPFNDHALAVVHRIHLREVVRIGIPEDNSPFSYQDAAGVWQGYDVYFARRIAKEILDDKPKRLRFVPVTSGNWVEQLESDQVDIALGFASGPEQGDMAEFALPYRRAGETLIAPAVRKGDGELQLWLNDVINRRVEDDFFHKAYEATLRRINGNAVDPDTVVIERGRVN